MIVKPLLQNPLGGGALLRSQDDQLQGDALVERMQMRMTQRDQKTPAFMAYFKDVMDTKGYPTKTMEEYGGQFPNPLSERIFTQEDGMNLSGSNVPLSMLNVTPPSVPVSEQTPLPGIIGDPADLGSAGPSLFPTKIGGIENTAIASLPQPTEGVSQDVFGNPNYLERSVSPIVTGPEELAIASNQQIPDAGLFNRVGQQMIGYDDQFSGINNRLNKIEEGIASLVQNRGQGLNMNTGGLGYFFNPFGGFYG